MLEARAAVHHRVGEIPGLGPDGRLTLGGAWVALSPVEARLAGALVRRFGLVVDRASLAAAGHPDGPSGRAALDTQIARLRRRLAPLGLEIRTIRLRGYLLQDSRQTADPET
jgi:DNA-binding response OmpR family regulator